MINIPKGCGEEESDLCGWSTHSFYKKNKSFFQQSPFSKLQLVKG